MQRRFNQSNNTPFLQTLLVEMVGLTCNTDIADLILKGQFEYDYLVNDTIRDIIRELKQKLPTTSRPHTLKLYSGEN